MKNSPGTIISKELLVTNPIVNLYLRIINAFFLKSKIASTKNIDKGRVKRILFSNNAHLGDVLISTAILPLFKENYPNCEIHFLCGSWSKEILEGNPLINRIYYIDHWKLNRSAKSFFAKYKQYLKTYSECLKQISLNEFDIAIDLYFYYPNNILLLWQCKIPIRIGYTSGGFGNLLTHPLKWQYKKQSVIAYHLDLLNQLPVFNNPFKITELKPFVLVTDKSINKITDLLAKHNFKKKEYIILHLGTGYYLKEWPLEHWKKLTLFLLKENRVIVFTGHGKHEDSLIDTIFADRTIQSSCINFCNELNLNELTYLIKLSQLVICVDSLISHIAGCFDTPCVIIGNGINDEYLWRPNSLKNTLLINPVSCMPCYTGCAGMECVRGTVPNLVLKSIKDEFSS